jgi:hypothetical protein
VAVVEYWHVISSLDHPRRLQGSQDGLNFSLLLIDAQSLPLAARLSIARALRLPLGRVAPHRVFLFFISFSINTFNILAKCLPEHSVPGLDEKQFGLHLKTPL